MLLPGGQWRPVYLGFKANPLLLGLRDARPGSPGGGAGGSRSASGCSLHPAPLADGLRQRRCFLDTCAVRDGPAWRYLPGHPRTASDAPRTSPSSPSSSPPPPRPSRPSRLGDRVRIEAGERVLVGKVLSVGGPTRCLSPGRGWDRASSSLTGRWGRFESYVNHPRWRGVATGGVIGAGVGALITLWYSARLETGEVRGAQGYGALYLVPVVHGVRGRRRGLCTGGGGGSPSRWARWPLESAGPAARSRSGSASEPGRWQVGAASATGIKRGRRRGDGALSRCPRRPAAPAGRSTRG